MKNKRTTLLISTFLVGIPTATFADESHFSVGVQTWANTWKTLSNAGATKSDNSVLMMGPSIKYQQDNFFASAAHIVSTTDYSFSDVYLAGDEVSIKKSDTDLIAGFMLTPRIGIYGNYKVMKADWSYRAGNSGIVKTNYSGLGVGILGNIPLSERAVFFGSAGIMRLEEEMSFSYGNPNVEDLSGATLELGVDVALSSTVTVNVGIKSQHFTYDSYEDETFYLTGLAAAINIVL